ncbi:hypothetical protein GGU11DRAFT_746627 [Lentinula aff. detonsa]|uniref:NAD(P)-binding domain-containing protein n=1 Tax=Lentinula aff. detonsa TaxID=2804958 RepID=A0AA38L6D7_9AGAR|nr:hypothetical protein GGU10DRAFT_309427 [Lentinula aff. detonsa]KAJ3795924.1 hypothetical protein GGU11DRAFT_746627 [Lentinula aff. detonsa]
MVRVLVLGGHGKVALQMTKILAAHNHKVTSVIRNPDHTKDIIDQYPENPSLIHPVMASIEETDEEGAKKLMEGIQWVVWSAGAGGKGGPERTKAVDEIAAKRFIKAALLAPSVTKFLMVSASSSRRSPASYWTESDIGTFKKTWESIGVYSEAKTVADEYLYDESRKSPKLNWVDICLRPGSLSDKPGTGKVDLGKAKLGGSVPREDVAAVAVELLEKENGGGLWVDLIGGSEPIGQAVERVVSQRITSRE